MKIDQLIAGITEIIKEKYEFKENECSKYLEDLCPAGLEQKKVIRLCRIGSTTTTQKTILLVELRNSDEVKLAVEWAALAKEVLLDPESADLYLFLFLESADQLPLEACLRIESTEQFCRKYVLHPGETVEGFIDRTFLAKLHSISQQTLGSDPLLTAFSSLEKDHAWFNKAEQDRWRAALLTGLSGHDLIETVFFNKSQQE